MNELFIRLNNFLDSKNVFVGWFFVFFIYLSLGFVAYFFIVGIFFIFGIGSFSGLLSGSIGCGIGTGLVNATFIMHERRNHG